MYTALTALTLGPQSAEPHFQVADFAQRFGVELANAGPTVLANGTCHLVLADQRFLASHARLRLFRELDKPAEGRRGHGDGTRVFASQELPSFLLPKNGIENTAEGLGKLVVEIVFGVDGDVVFKYVDGVFAALVVFGSTSAFDDHVGYAVTERRCGASIALPHAFGEFDMGLLCSIIAFRERLCDHKLGHVNFILQQIGYGAFDITIEG